MIINVTIVTHNPRVLIILNDKGQQQALNTTVVEVLSAEEPDSITGLRKGRILISKDIFQLIIQKI